MVKTQYGIIAAKRLEFTQRDLLRVPHKQGDLIVAYPAFGPNTYKDNVVEMKKSYSHPQTGARIFFREPTTSESILPATYDFENRAKPKIFDQNGLLVGRILKTSEGVFVNPPNFVNLSKSRQDLIDNEKILKCYIYGVKPVKVLKGHIYIVPDSPNLKDFGFAPYETFNRGVQDCDTFAHGGLARVLEHTEKKQAKNLGVIASPKFYKEGVNVLGFYDVEEPILMFVGLYSGREWESGRLSVAGGWDDSYDGYAFGVLDSGEATAKNN